MRALAIFSGLSLLMAGACLGHTPPKTTPEIPSVPFSNGTILIGDDIPDETPVCFEKWNRDMENLDHVWRNCISLGMIRKLALPERSARNLPLER